MSLEHIALLLGYPYPQVKHPENNYFNRISHSRMLNCSTPFHLCYSTVSACACPVENEVFRNWTLVLLVSNLVSHPLRLRALALPKQQTGLHQCCLIEQVGACKHLWAPLQPMPTSYFSNCSWVQPGHSNTPRPTPECSLQAPRQSWRLKELLAETSGSLCQLVFRAQKSPWMCLSRHVISGTSAASYPQAWFSDLLAMKRRAN